MPTNTNNRTDTEGAPETWNIETISAIADVKTGPFGSTLHERDYVEAGTPIITVEHLTERGILHRNLPMVSDSDRIRLKKYSLRAGDIVFSRVGSVDRNALVQKAEEGWLFSGRLLRVRVSSKSILPAYLSYYLHSEHFKRRIREVAVGQTMASLNTRILERLHVAFPSLPEQHTAANVLSDVDDLLQALEALAAKNRAVKRTAIQQLLTGKTRLPGFASDWRTTSLGEVAQIISGATPDTMNPAYWNGTIPWCTPTDITNTRGKYLTATNRKITIAGLANCPALLLPVGTLLLCTRATIGEVKISTFAVCTNQGFKSLIARDCVSNEFLYYVLTTLKPRLTRLATGSTFGEIGKHDIASIEVTLPPHGEQCAIAGVLSDMDAEIATLERRLDKIRAVKQGMMQQLLTGRVRLVERAATGTP